MYLTKWIARSLTGIFAAFAVLLPLTSGCANAVAPRVAASKNNVARAGIRYDAAAPLNAKVAPQFDAKNPPTLAFTYTVHFNGGNDAMVPALYFTPVNAAGKIPCVLLLHGLGGRKEDMTLLSLALAKRGYASLTMDIAGQGERPLIGGKPFERLDLSQWHQMCGQTLADLRRATDFLLTRPEIDSKRIGFLGVSLGGILGGVFVADEPRIHSAVFWAAGGDLGKMLVESVHPYARALINRSQERLTAARIDREMADVDPAKIIAQAAPRPLYFINGASDAVVPVACADTLFNAAPQPKSRSVLPGGHIPDIAAMVNQSLQWLDSNLKSSSVAAVSAPAG